MPEWAFLTFGSQAANLESIRTLLVNELSQSYNAGIGASSSSGELDLRKALQDEIEQDAHRRDQEQQLDLVARQLSSMKVAIAACEFGLV